MAKKPKRFATGDEVYSDYGSDEGRGAAGTSEISTKAESTRGAAGTSETVKPKAAPAPAPAPAKEVSSIRKLSREEGESIRKASEAAKPAPAIKPDETKMSLSERIKMSRERAREGTKTDTRSVSERLRSAFGMASGGKVSSASSRADGIAQKGKTRGRMC
jgi:hypothetical protein